MANNSSQRSSRRRPSYMLMFIDHLRRHNQVQPKYVPLRRVPPEPSSANANLAAAAARVAQRQEAAFNNDQELLGPSGRGMGAWRVSVRPEPAGPSNVGPPRVNDASGGSDPASTSLSPQTALADRTTRQGSNMGGSPHPASQLFNQRSPGPPNEQPQAPIALLAQYFKIPSLDILNSSQQTQLDPVSIAGPSSSARTPQVNSNGAQNSSKQPAAVSQLPSISKIAADSSAPVVNNSTDRPPDAPIPPQQPVRREVEVQLAAPTFVASSDVTSAERSIELNRQRQQKQQQQQPAPQQLLRLPLLRGAKIYAPSAKESNSPSLTQTPAAAVGTSNSLQQSLQQHQPGEPKRANGTRTGRGFSLNTEQKKISIARQIAEQTPNATETLGPGFVIRMPGEKSGQQVNADAGNKNNNKRNTGTATLEAVPSDYEHIFHCTSGLPDETQVYQTPSAPPQPKPKQRSPKLPKVQGKSTKVLNLPQTAKALQGQGHKTPQNNNNKAKKQADKKAKVKKTK